MIHQFKVKMDGYNTVFSIAFSEIIFEFTSTDTESGMRPVWPQTRTKDIRRPQTQVRPNFGHV